MFFPKSPVKSSGPMIGPAAPNGSLLQRALTWIVGGLGLPSNQVPSGLKGGQIQPTVEMYRPRLRELYAPTSIDPVDGGISFTVPDGVTWELVGLSLIFVTSATVGNRELVFDVIRSVAGVLTRTVAVAGNFQQAASLADCYSFGAYGIVGATEVGGNRRIAVPAPAGLVINPRWSIKVVDLQGVDVAGDVFQNICLLVKEHPGVQLS